VYRLTGGLEVTGMENTPDEGPLIVATSHSSYWDPMIMGAAFDRPLHFMARRSLFETPIFGWLIKQTLAFPLNREGDSREAIRAFGALLEQNEAVLIFPEGTRSSDGRLGPMKPGVGMIAVRYQAPVLPVYIWGSYQSWPRTRKFPRCHRLKVLVGPIIEPTGKAADRRSDQQRVTTAVDATLHALERKAWDGEADPPPGVLHERNG
jgi:1-acyl-sn-glycerol-3-phosphate acyltransferase